MSRANRREPRVPINLAVRLQTAAGEVEYKTKNVSSSGVFIVCEEPLPLRRLARFRTVLDDNRELQMLGLVAHRINRADASERGTQPGMGVQLYSVGAETGERWRDFVRGLVERDPALIKAMEERNLPHIRVRMSSAEKLAKFQTKDLPRAMFFYRTPDPFPKGQKVICEIYHEGSEDPFSLSGTVGERVEGGRRKRGMEIHLHDVDETTVDRFAEFAALLSE